MKDLTERATDWVADLAGRELRTPGYYYSVDQTARNIRAVKAAFGTELIVELTACPLQQMLSRLPSDCRFGVVTASRPEMNMVVAWETEHAYVRYPGLDQPLARAVIGAGHRLIAETPSQIDLLAKLKGKRALKPAVLSVNPASVGGPAGIHGMDRPTVMDAISRAAAADVAIDGLSLAWSGAFDADTAIACLHGLAALAAEIGETHGATMETLIMGEWLDADTDPQIAAYRDAIAKISGPTNVVHMAGASVFKNAGVLVTKVVDIVPHLGGAKAICDASLANAFQGTEAAGPRHNPDDLATLQPCAPGTTATIVGASGLSGDVFGQLDSTLRPGECLVMRNMGAFARTMTPAGLQGRDTAPSFLCPAEGGGDA